MTTPLVDRPWRDLPDGEALTPTRHPDRTPVDAVRIAQLQGVVIAVFGVSASTAVRELQRRSAQRNTSVADLAAQVMASVSGRRAPITPDVLGALLAGHPPPSPGPGSDPDLRGRRQGRPLASALHLVATAHPQATEDVPTNSAESWRWERDGLTRREAQVLDLIGAGLSNQDIAGALFVTVNTVKSYIRTAYRKIGVATRAQAVRWALTHEPFSCNSVGEGSTNTANAATAHRVTVIETGQTTERDTLVRAVEPSIGTGGRRQS